MAIMKSKIIADLFVGVEAGYLGNRARIVDPEAAAQRLVCYASTFPDNACFARICPAVAVYGTARGCPDGGEAVALVTLAGDTESILNAANSIYKQFNQNTLSICTHDELLGVSTRGFIVSIEGGLQQTGCLWQEILNDRVQKTGLEISCGIFQSAPRQITIQADANPHKILDTFAWEQAAEETIRALAYRLGKPIQPLFRDTGFTYLKNEI